MNKMMNRLVTITAITLTFASTVSMASGLWSLEKGDGSSLGKISFDEKAFKADLAEAGARELASAPSSVVANSSVDLPSATLDSNRAPVVVASQSVGEDSYQVDEKQQQQQQQQEQQNQQQQVPPLAPPRHSHDQQQQQNQQQQVDQQQQDLDRADREQRAQQRQQADQRQQGAPAKKMSGSDILSEATKRRVGYDLDACVTKLQAMETEICTVSRMLGGVNPITGKGKNVATDNGNTQSWAARRAYKKMRASERDMLQLGMSMESKSLAKNVWNHVTPWNLLKGAEQDEYSRCGKKPADQEHAVERTAKQYCDTANLSHSIYDIRKHLRNSLDSITKAMKETNPADIDALNALASTKGLILETGTDPNVIAAARAFDQRKNHDGVINQNAILRAPRALANSFDKAKTSTLHPSTLIDGVPLMRPEYEKETTFSSMGAAKNGTLPVSVSPDLETMFGKKRAQMIQQDRAPAQQQQAPAKKRGWFGHKQQQQQAPVQQQQQIQYQQQQTVDFQ